MVDVANYNQGKKGGKIRVRARIEESDKKTLLVKDVPYGVTTTQLIDSIIKANDSGKIKIKKVIDNTARDVEVEIQLAPGVSPDKTIDALYAFTDCEVGISPNACVIVNDKPIFLGVEELLKISTEKTKDLLGLELEIKRAELEEQWHYSSIEKIFIEKRIYRDIEECESFEEVIDTIWKGMNKFKKLFRRELSENDILRLTEIRIKRISKYDSFKADELMKGLEAQLEQVHYDIENLKAYAIKYFENLLKKYGKGKERKTEIRTFDTIDSKTVAIANQKLYVNRAEGFVGTGLKKDEYVCDCSDIDDIIVFKKDGKMVVFKVQDKTFIGKDIIHVDVFRKNDERRIYNLIYLDGKTKVSYAKRFPVTGITRDKEYDLTQGSNGSRILYFTPNPSGEAEVVSITLSPLSHARKLSFDFDFSELAIKGRSVQGNIVSKYLVKGIKLKSKGVSTLGGINLWYDGAIGRINTQEHGTFLGNFLGNDLIISIYKDGNYELTNFDVSNHFEYEQLLHISKFKPERPLSMVYFDAKAKTYYIKRFVIETQTLNKKFLCIPEEKGNYILLASDFKNPTVILSTGKGKTLQEQQLNLAEVIDVKGWKSIGNKFAGVDLSKIELLPPDPTDEMDELVQDETETLVNEDLFSEEQEKIKKLLEDDPESPEEQKRKPNNKIDPEQPKLF
jgi:topoisomerase-4 subunit A